MTATVKNKKERFVLAAQTALPDHVEPKSWSPAVLQHKASGNKLRLVLPVDLKQEAASKPQKPRNTTQNQEPAPITPDDILEHIASNRPFDVAQAIHTVLMRSEGLAVATHKVAVLLVGLGPELAASVLRQCPEKDTQMVVQALSELDGVTAREKDEICEEFRQILISGDYVIRAGRDYTSDVLRRAFSYHKAQMLLKQATGEPTRGFAMLENVDPNHIVPFISKEHPQTIALILSQLDQVKAASVLNGLLPHIQETVVTRLAQMDNISPAVLQEVEDNLAGELQAILSNEITQIGGPHAVAKILSHTGRATEKHILKSLDEKYPKLAEEIRNGLFVFDDIARLTDREIKELAEDVGLKDFAMALKGASEEAQNRVFDVYGEEKSKQIKQDMKHSGPTLMEDVEAVQLRVVRKVREFEAQGKITISPRARVYV
jgi:flagellar motor switch protein FliG